MNIRKFFRKKKNSSAVDKQKTVLRRENTNNNSTISTTERIEEASTFTLTPASRVTQPDEKINGSLLKIPELAVSEQQYYAYPLNATHWLEPLAKLLDGRQAYIFVSKEEGSTTTKQNYVFGKGQYGNGYYHLMTQFAWKILYEKYKHQVDSGTKQLLKRRATSKYRNDVHPNCIQTFSSREAHPKTGLSKDARYARNAMSSSVGLAACI